MRSENRTRGVVVQRTREVKKLILSPGEKKNSRKIDFSSKEAEPTSECLITHQVMNVCMPRAKSQAPFAIPRPSPQVFAVTLRDPSRALVFVGWGESLSGRRSRPFFICTPVSH